MREALKLLSPDVPFRGPASFQRYPLRYISDVSGAFEHFYGTEKIFPGGQLVYEGFYHGGTVGQRQARRGKRTGQGALSAWN